MYRTGCEHEVEASQAGAPSPGAEGDRRFEIWVRERLSSWSLGEIQAFDRWLLDEALYEFIPAVRAAMTARAGA